MPTVLTDAPPHSPPPEPPRKRWTRPECALLERAGIGDLERFELVEGELISTMGKRRPHVNAAVLLQGWLVEVFGLRFVNQEAPIDVAPEDNPTNEPVPDMIVLNKDLSHFLTANPGPLDLKLVVEISNTTLNFDLATKAALYARAGIPEYWVLDIPGRRLLVHRNPLLGRYAVTAYGADETVSPVAAAHAELRVGSLLLQ